jgi:hypothetical protein
MDATSREFLTACTPPAGMDTSPETDALYAQIGAVHQAVADIYDRLGRLRRLHALADATESDPKIFWQFEQFNQTFGAMEREVIAVRQACKALTDAAYQLDSYGVSVWERIGEDRPA